MVSKVHDAHRNLVWPTQLDLSTFAILSFYPSREYPGSCRTSAIFSCVEAAKVIEAQVWQLYR